MDKYKTNSLLKAQGFDVPKNILIAKDDWLKNKDNLTEKVIDQIQFPAIVKPHDDGCSVLINKATNKQELKEAIEKIFSREKIYAMIEEYVTGIELTVGVIGNDNPQALPPSKAVAAAGILSIEEKFLPGAGENQTPAPLPDAAIKFIQHTIENAYRAVGCSGYARIDCFYQSSKENNTGKERLIILEINTLPGLTPATCLFHQAAELGIKPMDFIDLIIQYGLERHQIAHVSQKQEQQYLKELSQ